MTPNEIAVLSKSENNEGYKEQDLGLSSATDSNTQAASAQRKTAALCMRWGLYSPDTRQRRDAELQHLAEHQWRVSRSQKYVDGTV